MTMYLKSLGKCLQSLRGKAIPVLELKGILSRRGPLSFETVEPAIRKAAALAEKRGALILSIDSPGGSPVQSDQIAALIRREAEEKSFRVYAVIQEVGASGGYWLACAADEIMASPMSIVGSIGVVGGGFGLNRLIERLGIDRRLYTAGQNKRRGDPFLPEKPEDVAFISGLMEDIHASFKDWVRQRRGARLTSDESAVFDGGYMLGRQAMTLGLIDGLTDLTALVEQLGGKGAQPKLFRPRLRRGLLSRLPSLTAGALLDAMEERRLDLR
ncbi:S49 family peptidase [Granulibacter bethesdensis]|uniref:S49 family peptidase n=1 Tax=Granulibacter bethesdensis TaxID=364410 RepID=UPI0003F20F02|nr:S49 family peptidase [Granulibacter bethesdensis]AHJ64906.1 Signal peptide peptidase sppA [Granulibacter bethesdensis CGDNIH4]